MLAVTAARAEPDNPIVALEIGDVPDPRLQPGWEVVRVRAASLNHHDIWTLRGVGIDPDRLPIVLGCDAAGVTEDGREVIVHALVPDDPSGPEAPGNFTILSERYDGTHAELVAVPSRNLIDKPAAISFEEASCLPTAWLTAYRMLFVQGGLRPGQRVLVQGAGGGVATAAILLGKAAGLRMYATSRDPAKADRAVELGAYAGLETGARLPERVDAVLETVGEATWGHSLRSVEAGGVIVVAGSTSGPNPPAELQRVFFRQVRVVGSTMGTHAEFIDLVRMLETSGVRPLIDSVRPLAEARSAYEDMANGEVFGKLVLTT
ncbi:MAG: zinc-binding dehydrogenase [Nitriliruptorales bacterium]|nr:zinc-binding dehydrogenase [Nitriliruptorales bacterium]